MLKRTPLKRSSKPIPKRRAKPRRGPLRCPEYRAWLRQRYCLLCSSVQSDAAHTENNGTGSKGPDSSCVPLCRTHHQEYDAGRKAFEKRYSLTMKTEARFYWLEFNPGVGRK